MERLIPQGGAVGSDWIVPNWPAPPNVRALCSTRSGGCSDPPYDSLNLGLGAGDAATAVAENRRRWSATIGALPVFLRQVHGTTVQAIDTASSDGQTADGAITRQSGVACTVMAADCLPVLFANADGSCVAAAHAGWRGLAGGVLESVLQSFFGFPRVLNRDSASEIIAWLGPCIGPLEFEVGDEVKAAFMTGVPEASHFFAPRKPGKWLADLAGLARQRLRSMGVTQIHGNDGGAGWCTVRNASMFFSHRRDSVRLGGSGRMAASVWLD
ncbi:MAG: peptidoglycan editing factor PgeF [Burkholderiales bacterium]